MTADLLVIGGGIVGLGIARLAARSGLSTVLLERDDLASGASSATSHMLHGGLRYLEQARFSLVRESLAERAAVSRMAGSLARPERFLVPVHAGGRVGPFRLRIGLTLYDWLAGADGAPHGWLRGRDALALEPDLEPRGLLCAGRYSDAVMDDAGLAVAVARDAVAHGAVLHTGTEAVGARPEGDGVEVRARDRGEGVERDFAAKVIVNATGPWTDGARGMLARALRPGEPVPPPLLRPSRGVHLVYPRLTKAGGLLVIAGSDGRAFFVVPFGDHSLVGTTEVEVESPPSPRAARPTVEEIRYLARELTRVMPFARARPLAVTAGIRPLLAGSGGVGQASREHRVIDEGAWITVAGGKYTTFRRIARDAVHAVARKLGRSGFVARDSDDPLPGHEPCGSRGPTPESTPARAATALAECAVRHQFARRLEDVVRRRTRLWLDPERTRAELPALSAAMASLLGWSATRAHEEVEAVKEQLWEQEALLRRAQEEA